MTAIQYHVLVDRHAFCYTDADLQAGRARAYLHDHEPMAGPQRRLRLRVEALYGRMLALLTARNSRGESWAHDFMGDDPTHAHYERLDAALEGSEVVDLGEAIRLMGELLGAFQPGRAFHRRDDGDVARVYERNPARRARMAEERDALQAGLGECGRQLGCVR
jgi:hypothetical protein